MKFLVVFEDIWHNKESAVVDQGGIGTYIKDFAKVNNFYFINDSEPDWDKLNSTNPYDVGGFGVGFYDIDVYEDQANDEYAGRFMIFEVGIYD
jgi:hypothetical protein